MSLAASKVESTKAFEWTEEEDKFLKTIYTLGETRDWYQTALLMEIQFPGKYWTKEECKGRWNSILNTPDSKKSWSMRDELEILIVHKMCKNNWSSAAELLQGRSNNNIKNRFYSIFRKVTSKVKRMEVRYSCPIELLEILYILSLMELHIVNPSPIMVKKGRRGKNFIYNLMTNIYTKDIEKYKVELTKSIGREISFDSVWEEVAGPLERSKFQLPENVKKVIDMGNIVKHLHKQLIFNRHKYSTFLPPIDFSLQANRITEEEKEFIASQTFALRQASETPCIESSEAESDSYHSKIDTNTPSLDYSSNNRLKRKASPDLIDLSPTKVKILEEGEKKVEYLVKNNFIARKKLDDK